MNKIWLLLLENAIKALVSGKAYLIIKDMVSALMDENIAGAEKKAKVTEAVMPYVSGVGKFVLSTAITFVVDSMRMKLETRTR